ncbi:sensor histidine kinase [Spirosoma montaniterrae]|uniref:histidine kinase n=1 Tax=Spirosoma montaniterrae TaxID=1178516 RepID=A0A1P9WXM8_9BACT|nr:HAMP domain-containing sensor histidine kinase [Spirosoma montaniterrae]AQG80068.1 histidine kinase [Spirosoma montaniterrae]
MTIRNRIALQFSLIVGGLLLAFSVLIYLTSAANRRGEFRNRLEQKARTTVRLLVEVQEVDRQLLRIIDRNTLTVLFNERVLVFDDRNRLLYASIDDDSIRVEPTLLTQIRQDGLVRTTIDGREVVGFRYDERATPVVAVASAYDVTGRRELADLRQTLFWSLLGGVALTIGLGIVFAGQSLRPISRLNEQISTINARNLQQRIGEGNGRDEVARLAANFNQVLERLQRAFEGQRQFVSHASHELRTPLAALKSEIQLSLRGSLTPQQHSQVLQTLLADTERLINLTNSLLFLARTSETAGRAEFKPVRLDDVCFLAQTELQMAHPAYQIRLSYDPLPQTDAETVVQGSEALLKQVVLNLLDNACKYTPDHTAHLRIIPGLQQCQIAITDQGIGIPPEQIANLFTPFFRADNALGYEGAGIGLSICERIAELHQGRIEVSSQLGKGSTFTLVLPTSSSL